jgi:predicted enzyme related to lactoylglutathione lyase
MALVWEQTVIDAHDPGALGRWWAQALGWVILDDETEDAEQVVEIRSDPDTLPGLLFLPVSDTRVVKNRLHLDFRPDDQQAEVDRLLALGAHRVDIGQGEASWVVLADPEGNEFCVLSSRPHPGA